MATHARMIRHFALAVGSPLKRRIDEAAKYIDLGQLCISPQRDFASSTEGNRLKV